MAEDFWKNDPERGVMSDKYKAAIIQECKIQAESCQYTSAALYEWLGKAKRNNKILHILQISIGAIASFKLLYDSCTLLASILALIAGVLPSIYEKLALQSHTNEIFSQAGQYKNLENQFRQVALVTALDPNSDNLKTEFLVLMKQIEFLRLQPLVIPEKYFQAARAKIKDGRYNPDPEIMS